MTRHADDGLGAGTGSEAARDADRLIREGRAGLVGALEQARGALGEGAGLRRRVTGWTVPLVAAGVGLIAAVAIRRYFRR
jgi:hypothetical protein